jgi:hypothetical protein
METSLAVANGAHASKVPALSAETMQAVVLHGDLSKLSPLQKVEYYTSFCSRVGLDPATQPFKILKLNGKEILYCDRGGTAQLNKQHKVSHLIVERKKEDDIYSVIARASTPDGRQTESIGAVSIAGLKGEALANAMMKAETKAKRRATLDLMGLGMLDESEIETIPAAQPQGAPMQTEPASAPGQPLRAPTGVPEAVQKDWRKWRALVNKRLQAAKTIEEINSFRLWMEEKHGVNIWNGWTFHDEFETFGALFERHKMRVERDAELESPEGIQRWIDAVMGSDLKGLEQRVKEYDSQDRLQTNECLEAIHERARQLGLDSADDLFADPDADAAQDSQG